MCFSPWLFAPPCILGTHHEKGAHTFWAAVNRLPLSSNAVLCWKFCHVFHKLLRDGHPNVRTAPARVSWNTADPLSSPSVASSLFLLLSLQVIKDSMRNKADLTDMSRMWVRKQKLFWHHMTPSHRALQISRKSSCPVAGDLILEMFTAVQSPALLVMVIRLHDCLQLACCLSAAVTDAAACDGQSHVNHAKCYCLSSQHVACQPRSASNRQ